MVDHNLITVLYKDAIALFCAASITISSSAIQKETYRHCEGTKCPKQSILEIASFPSVVRNDGYSSYIFMKTELWRYLRKGINYLEASGREVPVRYKHPGGKAYGPLALTPIAIKDVRLHYPLLAAYTTDDVLSDGDLYEKFAAAYAELLLKHYFKMDYLGMPKEEVFEVLQKGWFLGPTLYRRGRPVIASRQRRAAEYIDSPTIII